MVKKNDEFSEQLLEAFTTEGQEQVHNVIHALLRLESTTERSARQRLIETAYKELHNLKGSARGVQFSTIESFCHPLESILYGLKLERVLLSAELLDLILTSLNSVEQLFSSPDANCLRQPMQQLLERLCAQAKLLESDHTSRNNDDFEDMAHQDVKSRENVEDDESYTVINSMSILGPSLSVADKATQANQANFDTLEPFSQLHESPGPVEESESDGSRNRKNIETVRISTAKLDLVMQKAEEMLSIKLMARQQLSEAANLQEAFNNWTKQWAKASPELKMFRKLVAKNGNQSSEQQVAVLRRITDLLAWNEDNMKSLGRDIALLKKSAGNCSYFASSSLDSLLDETKHLLMMPCSSLFNSFHVQVRQLARQLNRDVDFIVQGDDIEIDKRILAEIKDPLTHALRNSLDHGIEDPEERLAQNKSRRAKLILSVKQLDAGTIEIRVSDDGRGIDVQKIKQKAIESGLYTPDELSKMSPDAVKALIFKSSFSTKQLVTEISGRGIGLSILEENVKRLGGHIRLESIPKQGTSIVMTLPVTITTFRGVLVEVLEKMFVIPTISIDRVVRIRKVDIKPVEGLPTMLLDDSLVPLCLMEDVLKMPKSKRQEPSEFLTVSVLGSGEARLGVIVDGIIEELEVLVKPLGPVLAGTPNISGLTILGSGKVVPILNVNDILKYTHSAAAQATYASVTEVRKTSAKILVVDDTLTARMLLRNIVEKAGFSVKTANDGAEALQMLQSESQPFDLLVTDLEMPKLNGFELTAAVRRDSSLNKLPVIMVTSKTSREDRERGVAVGANAYFVKSSFEQTNLVDVITSLIGH